MGRVIKFRAWDKKLSRWLTQPVHLDQDGSIYPYTETENKYDWDIDCLQVVIQQFTGLLDKNGKEIYEGDIILARGQVDSGYIIEWGFNGWVIRYPSNKTCIWVRDEVWYNMEVIGNIYENPELLNSKEVEHG